MIQVIFSGIKYFWYYDGEGGGGDLSRINFYVYLVLFGGECNLFVFRFYSSYEKICLQKKLII